jgi:hypothetical protein
LRSETGDSARAEINVLDAVSEALRNKIEEKSGELRKSRSEIATGDAETVVALHNLKEGLRDSLEELARRGYGRVVVLNEVDEFGKLIGKEVFRLSQANAGLQDKGIVILARNNRNASRLVSCRAGDEIEFSAPRGERFFDVAGIIDLEGVTPLLRLKPNAALSQFAIADDEDIDVVRDLRAFVQGLENVPPEIEQAPAERLEASARAEPSFAGNFWPAQWDSMLLGHEEAASLGSHFFTRTTREQEAAIQAVRGVTVVEGVAGTGKTSVALGRLKFFANFRSGEHLAEYGLDPNDWTDFDPSDMVGFVLNPSLVQYLKQTAERLELGKMKIQDFDEYRDHERQSRRLFGRPFQRSPERNSVIQRTIAWLAMLDSQLSGICADALSAILAELLPKPDTPDGRTVSETRWTEMHKQFWSSGPLRARVTGLIRRLGSGGRAGDGFRLQGILAALDRDVRLSDRELAETEANERRALREAVENVSQRFFRVFNPTELLPAAHAQPAALVSKFGLTAEASEAVYATARHMSENRVTDDDVVTALCLNALTCDRFERDIANIPYLHDFSERVAVFIDEYQDFSEQQVLLMAFRARPKYRQITVSGDPSQRLHRDGLSDIVTALPFGDGSIRSIFLDQNHRQSKPLAAFSNSIRTLTERIPIAEATAAQAPLTIFHDKAELAELATQRISKLPGEASIAVICPDRDKAAAWYELMKDGLDGCFRNPMFSERSRLTERFKTHFTTPLDAKGLEFDVVIVPDVSEFAEDDPIEINGLYVAVSRPRYALLVGCAAERTQQGIVRQLLDAGHFRILPG